MLGLRHFGENCLCSLAVNMCLRARLLRIALTEHWGLAHSIKLRHLAEKSLTEVVVSFVSSDAKGPSSLPVFENRDEKCSRGGYQNWFVAKHEPGAWWMFQLSGHSIGDGIISSACDRWTRRQQSTGV